MSLYNGFNHISGLNASVHSKFINIYGVNHVALYSCENMVVVGVTLNSYKIW